MVAQAAPRQLSEKLRLSALGLALAWAPGPALADPLADIEMSFSIAGKPIPPEIFADFGDAQMSDDKPIVVAIDALAAIDSNRYAEPIRQRGDWFEQERPGPGGINGPETIGYEYRGRTANGLMVILAAWSGGGSGTFYWLHVLDVKSRPAFNTDGSLYQRLDLELIRSYALGDRWQGDITIAGDAIRIQTEASLGGSGAPSETIEARRP